MNVYVRIMLTIFVIKDSTRALPVPIVSVVIANDQYCMHYIVCSLIATKCGRGVYFLINARDTCAVHHSSYQTNYILQGVTNRNRFMFYACVLIGDYIGYDSYKEKGLGVPPVKDTSKGTSYNSVVDYIHNPSQFIVFHNNQSYPEYLITFVPRTLIAYIVVNVFNYIFL